MAPVKSQYLGGKQREFISAAVLHERDLHAMVYQLMQRVEQLEARVRFLEARNVR